MMKNWQEYLQVNPTKWLLEDENPSVRYFTLKHIFGLPDKHKDVLQARRRIMEAGVAPAILAKQQPAGNWEMERAFYAGKYRSTVWQLIILAEHAADASDPRIKRACEFILEKSQDRSTGGFAMHTAERSGGGRSTEVIPCLTGNMVWSLGRFGYQKDPRFRKGIDWLCRYLRFDDGESEPPSDWPYHRLEVCYGRHSCFMGVVKGLKALAEIPEKDRSKGVQRCIQDGVDFLLKHHVYKKSHNPAKIAKPGWTRFGFPRMYQTDVLEIMLILTGLGIRDDRMQEAVDLIISRQNEQGRWLLQDTFNDSFAVKIEVKGKPSRWLTLNALSVLKRYYPNGIQSV
jgi:hypothetical protein